MKPDDWQGRGPYRVGGVIKNMSVATHGKQLPDDPHAAIDGYHPRTHVVDTGGTMHTSVRQTNQKTGRYTHHPSYPLFARVLRT